MSLLFTCSFDDGYPSDSKAAELLHKHGLRGTFFVPVKNRDGSQVMTPAQMRNIAQQFEIGSHTFDHCYLQGADIWEAYFQISEGKKQLEDLLGQPVLGFCYPGGKYTQRDIDLVRACQFEYARTVTNLCFDLGRKPYEMPTTVQFYPHARDVYVRNFARAGHWLHRQSGLHRAMLHDNWIARIHALFDYACTRGGSFHLWGHSKEIDELGAWDQLDRFLNHVAQRVEAPHRLDNHGLAARHFQRASSNNAYQAGHA